MTAQIAPRAPRWLLPAILLVALALRLAAMATPSIHHPDEIFQYVEAAHRAVFGYGAVPWEAHYGLRSPVFPAVLASAMAAGERLDPGGGLYLLLPRLLMVAASLALPVAGWTIGARTSRAHAAIAAFAGAVWAEFVYFAPHTLSENLAIAAAMPAAALLARGGERSWRSVAAAGMLLGLAVLIRFQFAPALAVLAIGGCGRDRRRWAALIAGGLVAAVAGCLIDLASGMAPFGWLVENVRQNLLGDRASHYGTLGPLGYVALVEHWWGWALLPIALLVRVGMKRQPALFWAAIANLVFHSLIAHKEYRFVEFSAAAFVLVAAIGSVDVARRAAARWPRLSLRAALAGAAAFWVAASAGTAVNGALREAWTTGSGALAAATRLRADPGLCGVGLLLDIGEWGGATVLHRRVPVSYFDRNDPLLIATGTREAVGQRAAGFNRIIAARGDRRLLPSGFAPTACFPIGRPDAGDRCIFARAGSCSADPASPFLLDAVFMRSDRRIRQSIARGQRPLP